MSGTYKFVALLPFGSFNGSVAAPFTSELATFKGSIIKQQQPFGQIINANRRACVFVLVFHLLGN